MGPPNWQALTNKLNCNMTTSVFARTLAGLLATSGVAVAMLTFAIPSPKKISTLVITDEEVAQLQIMSAIDVPPQGHSPSPPTEKLPENTSHQAPEDPRVESHLAPTPTDKPSQQATRKDIEDAIVGLYQSSPFGQLPIKRASDDKTSFDLYRAPFSRFPQTKGVISLVVADYGLSDKLSAKAITELPPAVSLALSPYARNMQPKLTGARAYGHEVWLQLPIQDSTYGQNDPGPATLLSGLKKDQNIARLKTILGRATGYAGITLTTRPDFSGSADGLDFLFDESDLRGLGIVAGDPQDTLTAETSTRYFLPFAQSDVQIDTSGHEQTAILLEKIESIALKNGHVIAYMPPSPKLMDSIILWEKTLAEKNIQLAPLSAGIDLRRK